MVRLSHHLLAISSQAPTPTFGDLSAPNKHVAASWPNESPRGAGATAGLPWEMDPGEEEQLMLEQMQYEAEGW